MKAAGWMIFIGDMLHNFIDGLTLGAAFMVSIGEGLRMTLPIACEEFPHELGDIAVLLSSGLSIGQALVVNFLAACSCYLGFFIGAKLGLFIFENYLIINLMFVFFCRRIRRISSMDLCISWWNVCLYWTCRYGRLIF